jgi:integrase
MDIVEKYRKLAGITKKFSCHSLRHTCATYKAVRAIPHLICKTSWDRRSLKPP